jgi:hypothetical protein
MGLCEPSNDLIGIVPVYEPSYERSRYAHNQFDKAERDLCNPRPRRVYRADSQESVVLSAD